jgi:hypothetical protein
VTAKFIDSDVYDFPTEDHQDPVFINGIIGF